jgi:hypothetical protein
MAKAAQKSASGGGGSLYYEIANFQSGMDLRKSPLTAPAGTLRLLQNAHVTAGGEIEKREAFVLWCTAPAGSLGMCALNSLVYTHLPSGTPGQIDPPTDTAIGVIHIAQPRAAVTFTGVISDGNTTTPGAGTILKVSGVTPAGVLPVGTPLIGTVAEIQPGTVITAVGTVDSGGNGTYTVNISQLSYPSGAPGAPVSGVTLQYQLDFDTFNGVIYAVFQGSDGNNYHYYNGIQVVQATGKGYNIRTYKEKMYGVNGRTLSFSAIGDPTVWQNPSPDNDGNVAQNHSGFINVGAQDADSENMVSMEVYYDKMALFSTLACQLWFLDPDESKNQYYQTLRDAGTIAPASVRQYVANDVYFLGNHGIRSLRARDLTMTAAVADVGSPLDPTIQDLLEIRGEVWGAWQSQALLAPRTGRIWFTFGDRIYVLSNYASPNISAWSVYIPEFFIDIQGAVFADPYLVFRDSNTRNIYRFGSQGAQIYDSCPVEFITPFLSFDKPASFKFYSGFDAICTAFNDPVAGQQVWTIKMSFDPVNLDPGTGVAPVDTICTIDNATVLDGRIPISGRGTHVQITATYTAPGPATFSKIFVHYAPSDTD